MNRKIIAVCGCWLYEDKQYSFLNELNKACLGSDYMIAAFNLTVDQLQGEMTLGNELHLLELLKDMPCTALVILAELITSKSVLTAIRDAAAEKGIPVFSLDRHVDKCVNISVNYENGFKSIVTHVLKEHGCKRVAMIAGNKGNDFSELRIDKYKEALSECGIAFEPELLKYGDYWDMPARAATEELLKLDPIPEAIVCANDSMALAACDVIRNNGLRVPEDIIVTGFDGIFKGKLNHPPLATVAPDYEREVQIIMEQLDAYTHGKAVSTDKDIIIDLKVIPNQSCGCVCPEEKTREELVSDLSDSYADQQGHLLAMNRMLLDSAEKDHLHDIAELCEFALGLWMDKYYFAGIYANLLQAEEQASASENLECLSILNIRNREKKNTGEYYNRSDIIPDLWELTDSDSGINLLMFRLLYTRSEIFGYLAEGFDTPTSRDLRRCEEFGMFISTSLSTIRNNQKLTWLNARLTEANRVMEAASSHDYLTGILNRRGFFEELSKLIKAKENHSKWLTLFSIDMDGLKYINDTFGHIEGDFAIRTMASAIKNFSARNGICARYGGDEFACALITEERLSLTPDTVRERLESFIAKNEDASKKNYPITASIGDQCSIIDAALDIESIINSSDERMYADKEKRRKRRR